MKKKEIRAIIERLLGEIEEEDVGINLFAGYTHEREELRFFQTDGDRERVEKILTRLAEDSKRHKKMLEKLITRLGEKAA